MDFGRNATRTRTVRPGLSGTATATAVNPRNSRNFLAGQNDYRRGDSACAADFSLDGGRHFGSETLPTGFTAPGVSGGQRHYWNANGDPSVAFDSRGTAYYFCLLFDRPAPTSDVNGFSSGLFLYRSTDGGASWSFPGSLVKQTDGLGAIALLDKPYMTLDTGANSRFRDRIYAAWVEYNPNFSADPVSFAWSSDAGATWHLTGAISGTSASLCPVTFDGSPAAPATPPSSRSRSSPPTATSTWSSRTSTTRSAARPTTTPRC